VIDNTRRQRNASHSGTPSSLLQKFVPSVGPKPRRQRVVVEIKDADGDRKKILRKIKKGEQVVDPAEVEAALGIHGFSDCYSIGAHDARMRSRAQPKAKKIKRSTVNLDWNHHPPPRDPKPKFDAKTLLSPREQVRVVNASQFEDLPGPPVTFSNDVNAKQLDGKFQFISSYVKRPGVTIARKEGWGCRCAGVCGPNSCDCLLDIEKKFDDKEKKWPGRDPLSPRKIVPYKTLEDGLTVLEDNFLAASVTDKNSEIVECDESCGCARQCWNRVVGRGRTLPLEVFMTAKCGFGLRSSAAIARGQFIDVYLGELLTESWYQARELAAEDETPSYVFTLDWFDTSARTNYHVDGLHFGGPTRFINHSCSPNCRIFSVFHKGSDKKVYQLAVFAVQDVPPGKELTIDYNPLEAGKVYSVPRGDGEEGVVLCRCGEPKCRVRLWPDKESKKGRGFSRS
jgi:[histone H3]-lysine9 N-trimethyltransferase SUV39H